MTEVAPSDRMPRWLLGVGPLILIAIVIGLFAILKAPGISDTSDRVPEEVVTVEKITLKPEQIILTVRNEGADPVTIAQVNVSDYFAQFTQGRETLKPLRSDTITIEYPWVKGDPYTVDLITSTGGKIAADIQAAAPGPEKGASFFGLMALLGIYVGVIPIALGFLWMPFIRRSSRRWLRGLMAFTVGLLAFLALDATLEGLDLVAGTSAFGGSIVVLIGAFVAYLALEGVEGYVRTRTKNPDGTAQALPPATLALLISIGIGLHNLGEGLAIGSAYAVGSLALGAFLVVGFAIHNTTEGLAIVSPLASERVRPARLALLGLIAGGPAILGALIGSTVYQPALAAFLFGLGAGAVAQVAIKILPMLKDGEGRTLSPLTAGAMVAGVAFMFATGLLVTL
ncbi:MAG: family metal transporter [Nocardioidaceae bacterium]|nr:family metal transporter [Nocardioidaceae bacterium]